MGFIKRLRIFWVICVAGFTLVACSGGSDPSVRAVEKYLQAMISGDATQTAKLACKDFESHASADADSFGGVKASLQGVACKKSGSQDGADLVTCSGKISATYGNEQQEFDLAGPTYKVIQQNGDWLVCGQQ